MFTSHRQLLRTPNDQRNKRGTGLEFTPIGATRGQSHTPLLQSNLASRVNTMGPSPVARQISPLHKHNLTGSSFDNSYDPLNDDNQEHRIFRGTDILPDYSDDELEEPRSTRRTHQNFFSETGSQPLRMQQDHLNTLQQENINLRIELRTWKAYLDGQPADKKEIINNNVALNQENHMLRDEIRQLKSKLETRSSGSPDRLQRQQYESKLQDYEQKTEEMNREIEQLSNQKGRIESEKHSLETENDILKEEIQKLSTEIDKQHNESRSDEDQIFDLKHEIHALNDELDQMKELHRESNMKIKRLEMDLDQYQENDDDLNEYKDKIKDLEQDKARLTRNNQDLELELHRKDDNLSNLNLKLETLQSQINQLRATNEDRLDTIEKQTRLISSLESDKNQHVLERELKQLVNNESKYIHDIESLRNELSQMQEKYNEKISTVNQLKSRIRDLESGSNDVPVDESYIQDIEADRGELYDSVISLNDQLKQRGDKIKTLERSLKESELEIDSLVRKLHNTKDQELNAKSNYTIDKSELSKIKTDKEHLEHQLEELQAKLSEQRNRFASEIDQLDAEHRQKQSELFDKIEKLEDDKFKLIEEYESIQLKCNDLISELNSRADDSSDVEKLEQDLRSLSIDYKTVCSNLEKEQITAESIIGGLKQEIKFKESEINNLMDRSTQLVDKVKDLQRSDRTRHEQIMREQAEILKDKLDLEEKYDNISMENRELKKQISNIKLKESTNDEVERIEQELREMSKEKSSLFKDLQSKTKDLKEMKWKVDGFERERKDLLKSIDELDKEQGKVKDENSRLTNELKTLRDNIKSHNGGQSLKQEELSAQLKEKDAKIKNLVIEYNQMKNDLLERYENLRSEKIKLAAEVNELSDKLKRTTESQKAYYEKELKKQQHDYPMTPKTPSNSPPNNSHSATSAELESIENRVQLLETQKKLYRLKLQQYKSLNSDLKYASNFLINELNDEYQSVSTAKNQLDSIPSFPLSYKKTKNLTFRAVALTVFASIRLKNRLKELKFRKNREMVLKNQISKCA